MKISLAKYLNWRLEKRQESFNNLQGLIKRILEPEKWGFLESYRHVEAKTFSFVIYDSPWCRVNISQTPRDMWEESRLDISYGRLHAANEEATIIWNDQKCRAWHQVYWVLEFLDGLTPQEATQQRHVQDQRPQIIEPFRKRISKEGNLAEIMLEMHAAIWRHYGVRFFELFDLRRPDLWEGYRKFLKEYYDIKGRSPRIDSPPDQVC